jgi:hypothetical protein
MRRSTGLLLCAFLLASLLASNPAHASEKKVMGDVVVQQGETKDEVSTVWGNVRVDGEVKGDVRSAVGNIEIYGPVGGDVEAGSGNVWLYAPVAGDVDVGHGDLHLESGAQVGGNVSRGNGSLYRQPDAVVSGAERAGMASEFDDADSPLEAFSDVIGWAIMTLGLVAAAVLVAVASPRSLRAATRSLEAAPGRSFVLGLSSVPVAVVLSILLALTGVGLLLLPLFLPAYLALVFFGVLVVAYFLGRKVVLATGRYRAGDALAAAIGAILVAAASQIPFLGGLVFVALALLGAGATFAALLTRWRPRAPRVTYASYEDYLRDRQDG